MGGPRLGKEGVGPQPPRSNYSFAGLTNSTGATGAVGCLKVSQSYEQH